MKAEPIQTQERKNFSEDWAETIETTAERVDVSLLLDFLSKYLIKILFIP